MTRDRGLGAARTAGTELSLPVGGDAAQQPVLRWRSDSDPRDRQLSVAQGASDPSLRAAPGFPETVCETPRRKAGAPSPRPVRGARKAPFVGSSPLRACLEESMKEELLPWVPLSSPPKTVSHGGCFVVNCFAWQ